MADPLFRAVRISIVLTALSRMIGMVRQVVISSSLGLTVWADAYQVGFRLANLFRLLLGEGAVGGAFIPVYTGLISKGDHEGGGKCFSLVFNYFSLILLVLVGWGVLYPEFFVNLTAVGLKGEVREKAILMTQLMFPYLFFVGLAGLWMAVLNSHRHFTVTAAQPIIWNLFIILSPLAPFEVPVAFKLGWGVVIGGLFQWLVQIPVLSSFKVRLTFQWDPRFPPFQKVLLLLGPVLLASLFARINSIVDQRFASLLPTGSISALNYALILLQTPLGIFGVSVATAFFPDLSERAETREDGCFVEGVNQALKVILWLGIPTTLFMIFLGEEIISLLFQQGRFNEQDTLLTARALRAYIPALVPLSLVYVLNRVFFALQDTKTTLWVGIIMVFINYYLDSLLVESYGIDGLAFATSLVSLIHALLLLYFLKRKFNLTLLSQRDLGEDLLLVILCGSMVLLGSYGRILVANWGVHNLDLFPLFLQGPKIIALINILTFSLIALPIYLWVGKSFSLKGFNLLFRDKTQNTGDQ